MAKNRRPARPIGLATRSFKVDDGTWERLKARSIVDNESIAYVLSVLAEGYGRNLVDLPTRKLVYPGGSLEDGPEARRHVPGKSRIRSFRVSYDIWERMATRAARERVTRTYALTVLIEGYGQGLIELPTRRLVYVNGFVDDPVLAGR